jgi:hypothetical protein
MLDFFVKSDIPRTCYDRYVIIRLPLFPSCDRRILTALSPSGSGNVDKSSFYVGPDELNANSISHIKPFKPWHQLSFLYDHSAFKSSILYLRPNPPPLRGGDG